MEKLCFNWQDEESAVLVASSAFGRYEISNSDSGEGVDLTFLPKDDMMGENLGIGIKCSAAKNIANQDNQARSGRL